MERFCGTFESRFCGTFAEKTKETSVLLLLFNIYIDWEPFS